MKRHISDKEKLALKRISGLISKKLTLLGRMREPVQNIVPPVSLLELVHYQKDIRQVPVCNLILLLEFYGCSPSVIAEWNVKISVLTFRALRKARGEEIPHPELDL